MSVTAPAAPWHQVATGDDVVAVVERAALDQQASRFRENSELSWLHRAGGGIFVLSDGLAEAVGVALAAARWTGGRADPTVGEALISLGYDRDFALIDQCRGEPPAAPAPAPGWHRVRLDGPLLRLPPGIRLDLGATAKGLGSDRAVRAVMSATGHQGGVLVSLGGDIAVAGTPPRDGWPVTVAEAPDHAGPPFPQLVRLGSGAVATSSVACRRWRRGGVTLHHIVDPHTGRPADGPWRTASVAAATCADANAAATAAIVAGQQAVSWLTGEGLPARLVGQDGEVRCLGGWPPVSGWPVSVPSGSHVYAGARPPGGAR